MNGAGMERRLTDEQEAQIRMLADNFDDLVAQRYGVLLEEVDALRAGWDIETRMRMDAMAERDSALARAEAAEAERDRVMERLATEAGAAAKPLARARAAEARIAAALAIGPVRADDIGSDGARVGTRGAAVCFDYREAVRAALAESDVVSMVDQRTR